MDLGTDYLGMRLRNPLVAAASPLSQRVAGIRRLAAAGVGAVVVYSFFEEDLGAAAARPTERGYLPPVAEHVDAAGYLRLLEGAAGCGVPVIGSLNGATPGGWARYARSMQDAGASAVELNVYVPPVDPGVSRGELERRHLDVLAAVRGAVTVPVAVKVSPHAASVELLLALDRAGADGLVLFNRFLQPDIDPDTLTVEPRMELSTPVEGRVPRAWIAVLRRQVRGSLAGTTGVDRAADVAAYLLAGADAVMTASALLRHGVDHVGTLLDGLTRWLAAKDLGSVDAARGMLSVPADTADGRHVRAGYVNVLETAKFSHSRW